MTSDAQISAKSASMASRCTQTPPEDQQRRQPVQGATGRSARVKVSYSQSRPRRKASARRSVLLLRPRGLPLISSARMETTFRHKLKHSIAYLPVFFIIHSRVGVQFLDICRDL